MIALHCLAPFLQNRPAEEQQGWMSYLGKALATPASMLPAQVCVHVCVCVCLPYPSNQTFYRLLVGYWMGGGDHEVPG